MAHRDLNEKSIPLTSYPSLASAPPQGLVYAQPVATAPPNQQVPYAQPTAPMYQPYTQGPHIPAAQPVYAPPPQAEQPEYHQPVAQPVSVPQSIEALKTAVRDRQNNFNTRRYLSDAHRFTCKNFCKLLAIMLLWFVVSMGVNCAIDRIAFKGDRPHARMPNYWEQYPEPQFPNQPDDFTNEPQEPAPTSSTPPSDPVNPPPSAVNPVNNPPSAIEPVNKPPSTMNNPPSAIEPVNPPSAIEPVNPPSAIEPVNPPNFWDQYPEPQFPKDYVNPPNNPPVAAVAVAPHHELCRFVLWGALHCLVALLLWGPAAAGMFLAVFNAIRTNSKIKFRDFFRCFCCRYYCKLLGLNLVVNIVRGLLYLLFILPGVWWTLVTLFALPLHKEYPFLGVRGSIKISKMAIHRHFCQMICFLMLLGLLQLAGLFCFMVGLLYTLPLAFAALCFCFDDIIGLVPSAPLALPMEDPHVTVHV